MNSVLISTQCGAQNLDAVKARLSPKFGDKIVTTENQVKGEDLTKTISEIKDKNFTHYVTAEGLTPATFKAIKDAVPTVTILKVGNLARVAISDDKKISTFTPESKIQEFVKFASESPKLEGVVNGNPIKICRITRHDLKGEQETALKGHYPNASIAQITQTMSVDEIMQTAEFKNAAVVESVLPPHMVEELLKKKDASVQVIRAQLSAPPAFTFQHYEEMKETVVEMKDFA